MTDSKDGFILLSRNILDSPSFQNANWFKVWVWCLLKATHKNRATALKTGRGETVVKLKRGQFVFGRYRAAKELKMKPSTVWFVMQKLRELGNLDMQTNTHYTLVTIRNYDAYQDMRNYPLTPTLTTNRQPTDTDKELKEVYIKDIYSHWNSLGIVVHRKIEPHQRHISARLRDGYSSDELKEAMGNYAAILKSDDCFFSYRWGLGEFLRPANLDRFLSSANPHETFRKKQGGGNGSSPHDPVEAAMRREMEAAG
jgi:hypothetical protein